MDDPDPRGKRRRLGRSAIDEDRGPIRQDDVS